MSSLLQIWVQPECLTEMLATAFQRLRVVNLVNIPEGSDLTWTMFILEAAPSLEEFYMSVCSYLNPRVFFMGSSTTYDGFLGLVLFFLF